MNYKNLIKPFFDVLLALLGVVILFPFIILIAGLLLIATKENPFFTQTRTKKGDKLFKIIKFKSMNNKRDLNGKLLPDSQRLTRVGQLIRKTSLDELPQLFNVISGDMSIVGPRPLLPEYLPLYSDEQSKRHNVKPGITGWAQVNGRNAITWTKKFELDVWYTNNQNFLLDLRILVLTIRKVILSDDISSDGHVTMPTFGEYLKNKKQI